MFCSIPAPFTAFLRSLESNCNDSDKCNVLFDSPFEDHPDDSIANSHTVEDFSGVQDPVSAINREDGNSANESLEETSGGGVDSGQPTSSGESHSTSARIPSVSSPSVLPPRKRRLDPWSDVKAEAMYVFDRKGARGKRSTSDTTTMYTQEAFDEEIQQGGGEFYVHNCQACFPHRVVNTDHGSVYKVFDREICVQFELKFYGLKRDSPLVEGIEYQIEVYTEDDTRILLPFPDSPANLTPLFGSKHNDDKQTVKSNCVNRVIFKTKLNFISERFNNSRFYIRFTPVDDRLSKHDCMIFSTPLFSVMNKDRYQKPGCEQPVCRQGNRSRPVGRDSHDVEDLPPATGLVSSTGGDNDGGGVGNDGVSDDGSDDASISSAAESDESYFPTDLSSVSAEESDSDLCNHEAGPSSGYSSATGATLNQREVAMRRGYQDRFAGSQCEIFPMAQPRYMKCIANVKLGISDPNDVQAIRRLVETLLIMQGCSAAHDAKACRSGKAVGVFMSQDHADGFRHIDDFRLSNVQRAKAVYESKNLLWKNGRSYFRNIVIAILGYKEGLYLIPAVSDAGEHMTLQEWQERFTLMDADLAVHNKFWEDRTKTDTIDRM